jgi:hypothetical protein
MPPAHTSAARGCSLLLSFLAVLGPTSWCAGDERGTGSALERTEFARPAEEPETKTFDEVAADKAREPESGTDSAVETGTDPAKLLFRFEVNPQYIELPDDGHLFSTNFKLDVPLSKSFATALELPVVYAGGFLSPIDDQFGLGDIFVRARNVWSFERSSLIAGTELGLKTADDELLGSGKWQLNPTLAYVHYLSSEYLLAVAGKQRLSIAGDDDRADINQSEPRLIGIYINPKGWWLQADYQPKINWEKDGDVTHLIECEAGTMLSRSVGVSIRPGVGIGENRERDWSIGIGLRLLF